MLAVGWRGGDAFGGGSGDLPVHRAGDGIEAGDLVGAAEKELGFAGDFEDDGRGIVRQGGAGVAPLHGAGFAVEPADGAAGRAFVVGRDDDEIAVDRGGGTVALVFEVRGDLGLPELFAIEIERGRVDGIATEEIDIDPLTVAGGGTRGPRGLFVDLLGEALFVNHGGPEELASGAVEAMHGLDLFLLIGGGEVDTVAHDAGRAMASAWDGDRPPDVRFETKFRGRSGVGRRDSVAPGAAPPGPVARKQQRRGKDGQKEKGAQGHGEAAKHWIRVHSFRFMDQGSHSVHHEACHKPCPRLSAIPLQPHVLATMKATPAMASLPWPKIEISENCTDRTLCWHLRQPSNPASRKIACAQAKSSGSRKGGGSS